MAHTLSTENREFALAVAEFCRKSGISISRLSAFGGGLKNHFGRSAAHRFTIGQTNDFVIEVVRPELLAAFAEFLARRGRPADEIETELSELFKKEIESMIGCRSVLPPEAVRFFGLSRDPFDVDRVPAEGEEFLNTQIESVIARVRDAALYQRFVAVIGDVGSGKTLIKLIVSEQLIGRCRLIYPEFLDMHEVSVHGIVHTILTELGQRVPQNREARVTKIKDILVQFQREGTPVAIVLDESHRLDDRVISSLKNFWELTNGRSSRLLGVLLFGQPKFNTDTLRKIEFREIRERVQIIDLPPFTEFARDYLAHRITGAGGDLDSLFDSKSVALIAATESTPLALGNLANECLLDAAGKSERRVTSDLPIFQKLKSAQGVVNIRRRAA